MIKIMGYLLCKHCVCIKETGKFINDQAIPFALALHIQ